MTSLRSLVYLLFFALSTIFYALPISIFGWFLPYNQISVLAQRWGRVNLRALKIICRLDYGIRGEENLPSSNCIVIAKHQSTWETIALRGLFPAEQTWVLKRQLLWVPFFGWALVALRPIAVDRKNKLRAIKKLLKDGEYSLKMGRWVMIFPEGTRVAPGEHKEYSQGGTMLAKKTGYQLLPIAHNAGVFWRRRDISKYPGKIQVVIGKPIDPSSLTAADIQRRVEDWIEGTVAELPRTRS